MSYDSRIKVRLISPTVTHVSPLLLYTSRTTDQNSKKCFDAGRAIETDQLDSQKQKLAIEVPAAKRQADDICAQIRAG